jgi:hypothetical protein
MQETAFPLAIELLQHTGHGSGDRPPLVDQQWIIDPHADQEDDESPFKSCGQSIPMNHGYPLMRPPCESADAAQRVAYAISSRRLATENNRSMQ